MFVAYWFLARGEMYSDSVYMLACSGLMRSAEWADWKQVDMSAVESSEIDCCRNGVDQS